MQADCRNIYQAARKVAGLTQEKAAEMIAISGRSLADYETGGRIPSNATVELMVMVYNSQLLATQHLRNSAEFARDLLPAEEAMRLPEAVLTLWTPSMILLMTSWTGSSSTLPGTELSARMSGHNSKELSQKSKTLLPQLWL